LDDLGEVFGMGDPISFGGNKNEIYQKIQVFDNNIIDIGAGRNFSVLCSKQGNIFSLGKNKVKKLKIKKRNYSIKLFLFLKYGCLGIGSFEEKVISIPQKINTNKKIIKISVSEYHTLILNEEGKVEGFGLGNYCQLGNGSVENKSSPFPLSGKINSEKVIEIKTSPFISAVLTNKNELW
jgi:alpha-tubulin suppressor-like RCC1 family protein